MAYHKRSKWVCWFVEATTRVPVKKLLTTCGGRLKSSVETWVKGKKRNYECSWERRTNTQNHEVLKAKFGSQNRKILKIEIPNAWEDPNSKLERNVKTKTELLAIRFKTRFTGFQDKESLKNFVWPCTYWFKEYKCAKRKYSSRGLIDQTCPSWAQIIIMKFPC